jgi:hypothetical protein
MRAAASSGYACDAYDFVGKVLVHEGVGIEIVRSVRPFELVQELHSTRGGEIRMVRLINLLLADLLFLGWVVRQVPS